LSWTQNFLCCSWWFGIDKVSIFFHRWRIQLRKMRGRRRGGIDILINLGDFIFLSFFE
jgi:hypothetical protein